MASKTLQAIDLAYKQEIRVQSLMHHGIPEGTWRGFEDHKPEFT